MEKELSAKDSRFKLGEEFKEDIQVKPDMSVQARMKVKLHTRGRWVSSTFMFEGDMTIRKFMVKSWYQFCSNFGAEWWRTSDHSSRILIRKDWKDRYGPYHMGQFVTPIIWSCLLQSFVFTYSIQNSMSESLFDPLHCTVCFLHTWVTFVGTRSWNYLCVVILRVVHDAHNCRLIFRRL